MALAAITIRSATPRDATHLVAFIDMAGEGLPSYFWQEIAEPGQGPFEVGRIRVLRNTGAFSWSNASIAAVDGLVAGGMISYLIEEPVELSRLSGMSLLGRDLILLESEVQAHWYVNALAVYPEFRGQGVGRALLDHANSIGRECRSKAMAIIVASENDHAFRLYRSLGYCEKARRPLIALPGFRRGGDWVLLTRQHAENRA